MTNEEREEIQAKFEAWANKEFWDLSKTHLEGYSSAHTRALWIGYVAGYRELKV